MSLLGSRTEEGIRLRPTISARSGDRVPCAGRILPPNLCCCDTIDKWRYHFEEGVENPGSVDDDQGRQPLGVVFLKDVDGGARGAGASAAPSCSSSCAYLRPPTQVQQTAFVIVF